MSLTENPELVTVQMHWMISFIEILDNQVYDFDSGMLNDKVVLQIISLGIDAIRAFHGVEGLVPTG